MAEDAVRLEFSGARPVQGELEQGHRRARAPHPQDAHAIPPFCFQVSICTQPGVHADAGLKTAYKSPILPGLDLQGGL